jgi:hypothetical protein
VSRPVSLLLMALAASAAAGCGETPRAAPRQPVRLTLSAPQDAGSTRDATVQVSGHVAPPTSHVLVVGERVPVASGTFSTMVDVREGPNVIDVGASAPGMRATWLAVRVTRHSLVRLPALVGREQAAARGALEDLGLHVSISNDDDIIDAFRSGPELVCSSDPEGGAQVQPASEVDLVVSKSC